MPVARIEEIGRKILSSLLSLITLIAFMSYIPIYLHNFTNNNNYIKFNKQNNKNDIWIHNNGDVEKEESLQISMWVAVISLLGIGIPIYIILYVLCRYNRICILYYLNNLCNWLLRRNQDNEPTVDYRGNRIYPSEQENVHPLQYVFLASLSHD